MLIDKILENNKEMNFERKKSSFLMKELLLNLPNEIIIDILDNSQTILNLRCSLGDSTNEIKNFFDKKKVYGLDISKDIIDKAQNQYKEIEFILDDKIINSVDVVFNNSLEHFKNNIEILKEHFKNTNKYYIMLIPYIEKSFDNQSLIRLDQNLFPESILTFEKTLHKEIVIQNEYFGINKLLVIYKNKMTSTSSINNVETWDKVAETYTSKIDDIDIELGNYLLDFYKINNLSTDNSIIELGCGSGHISLKLKESGIKNVCLLDFSLMALEKAKKIFDKNEATFINGDLLDLNLNDKYDITWNSGVLEHLNDEELLKIINNIYSITKKYFICIVPNPKSLIYLLMRRNRMVNDSWSFGIEYLRTNYEEYFEKVGFKVKKIDYVGYEFSKYFLKEVFMERYEDLGIDDLLINDLYLKENNYLQVFVCEVK